MPICPLLRTSRHLLGVGDVRRMRQCSSAFYRCLTEARFLNQILEGRLTREVLRLSMRFDATRDPDVHNEHLIVLCGTQIQGGSHATSSISAVSVLVNASCSSMPASNSTFSVLAPTQVATCPRGESKATSYSARGMAGGSLSATAYVPEPDLGYESGRSPQRSPRGRCETSA